MRGYGEKIIIQSELNKKIFKLYNRQSSLSATQHTYKSADIRVLCYVIDNSSLVGTQKVNIMSDLVNLSSEEFVKSVIARGGKVSKTGFGGGTRPSANPLEIGDVFTIPEDFKAHVYELPIAGSTYKYQFLRLQVKNGDKTSYKQVGPSVFSRTVPVVDDSGEPTGEIAQAAGGIAEEFCKHGDYNEAFTAIAGKAIKVTDKKVVLTQSYRSDRPTNNTAIYTTEFVKG